MIVVKRIECSALCFGSKSVGYWMGIVYSLSLGVFLVLLVVVFSCFLVFFFVVYIR